MRCCRENSPKADVTFLTLGAGKIQAAINRDFTLLITALTLLIE